MDSELIRMTAAELAAAISAGEVSAAEVTDAHLARIEEVDGRVRAFLHLAADQARAAARAVDQRRAAGQALGPLAGVPLVNVYREDTEVPCLTAEEALAAAPAVEQQRFRVPRILAED